MELTAEQALGLRREDDILVRKALGKRTFRAMVTDRPSQHGPYVLVPYRLVSRSRGATVDTYSRHEHVAQLGGRYPDSVTRA